MVDPVNAAELGRNGRIFCLTAAPDEILARLMAEGRRERPLLHVSNPAQRIAGLLAERQAGYGQFEQIVTDGLGADEVAGILFGLIGMKK